MRRSLKKYVIEYVGYTEYREETLNRMRSEGVGMGHLFLKKHDLDSEHYEELVLIEKLASPQ